MQLLFCSGSNSQSKVCRWIAAPPISGFKLDPAIVPGCIVKALKPYQREGVEFMLQRYYQGLCPRADLPPFLLQFVDKRHKMVAMAQQLYERGPMGPLFHAQGSAPFWPMTWA